MIIAFSSILYSLFQIYTFYILSRNVNSELKQYIIVQEEDNQRIKIDWVALSRINEDIVAWIMIPDTNISYPILKGIDNHYYLNHSYTKDVNFMGSIFLDYQSAIDFSDRNTFVYGHNVTNGTMFAEIEHYKDKDFFFTHDTIYLYTPYQDYRCTIISFHSTTAYSKAYTFNIVDANSLKTYVDIITFDIHGYVNEDVVIDEDDRLISLSTCSYEINNEPSSQRYLLHAKLIPF